MPPRAGIGLVSFLVLLSAHAAAAVSNVAASIKPIHSLVAAVMDGVGEPALIVPGAASPHTYSLKPSDAAALQAADIVFWVGPNLEAFLVRPMQTLASDATSVELSEAPGVNPLPLREGGAFEPHDHGEHESHAHDAHHGEIDMHIWLDPVRAEAMVDEIAKVLAKADPEHATRYGSNAAAEKDRLDALAQTVKAELAGLKDKRFIAFHDAYRYFEDRFGVAAAGSITVNPETSPGARRIAEIRDKVHTLGATCVFAEPQFEPRVIEVAIEGTQAHAGVLDPEGATLEPGPDLYFKLIDGLAASLKDCLSKG